MSLRQILFWVSLVIVLTGPFWIPLFQPLGEVWHLVVMLFQVFLLGFLVGLAAGMKGPLWGGNVE